MFCDSIYGLFMRWFKVLIFYISFKLFNNFNSFRLHFHQLKDFKMIKTIINAKHNIPCMVVLYKDPFQIENCFFPQKFKNSQINCVVLCYKR